jgi:hypothetical protein
MVEMTCVRRLAVVLCLVACAPAWAEPVTFRTFATPWNGTFRVVSARHDAGRNEIVWELEALKDTPLASYKAFVTNAEGVEITTVEVKFDPAAAKAKKKARLKATAPLGGHDVADVVRVVIQR